LKIGVDVSMLAKPKSGVGYYVLSLIEQMSLMNRSLDFYLYANESINVLPEGGNVKSKVIRSGSKPYWMQVLLPKALKKDAIDLFWGGNYTIPVAAGEMKKVVTVHDFVFKTFPSTLPYKRAWHLRLGMPFYLKYSDHILAVSDNTAFDLKKYYKISPGKVTVTKLAARKIFSKPPVKEELSDGLKKIRPLREYVLFVGTIEPRKGVDTLIKALSLIFNRNGDCPNLVLAGQIGWKSGSTIRLIKQLMPKEKVSILEYVEDNDLSLLYRGAKLFVYPSRYEGFGLPVLEAMVSGTPVITTNCSSLNEVGGDAAFYVEPDNEQTLSRAIEKIWSDRKLQNKMSNDGLKHAQKFSWEQTAQRTLNVFEDLLE
jgi:glycosyltransferase involved in cell wall biosynthesis